MEEIILIKYGELTTKKDNRNLFIRILYNNILEKLQGYNVKIIKNRVRMYIDVLDEDINIIVDLLKEVFGIHSIVKCYKVNTNIEDIKNMSLNILKKEKFDTFKIETKRSDKSFIHNSMEFNNIMGGYILKNIDNVKVNVHNPDYLFKIEIRNDYTYLYTKEISGLGGYPVGVLGKGLVMLSGGIDSPVAAFLSMKRGIRIECVYFESPPHTSIQARNKIEKIISILNKYQANIKLHIVNFTEIQEAIYKQTDDYMITIMRRMMYRISEELAIKNKCLCIINGENVGQVASQTLTSINIINTVTNYPVIRPVVCMDKLEIIDISKRIDTYNTSILPYVDCCTIFLPKHPVINPNINKCLLIEDLFDYKVLIEKTISNVDNVIISKDKKNNDLF